jgi:hypothetical protein
MDPTAAATVVTAVANTAEEVIMVVVTTASAQLTRSRQSQNPQLKSLLLTKMPRSNITDTTEEDITEATAVATTVGTEEDIMVGTEEDTAVVITAEVVTMEVGDASVVLLKRSRQWQSLNP